MTTRCVRVFRRHSGSARRSHRRQVSGRDNVVDDVTAEKKGWRNLSSSLSMCRRISFHFHAIDLRRPLLPDAPSAGSLRESRAGDQLGAHRVQPLSNPC
jgi:hypothetical protein